MMHACCTHDARAAIELAPCSWSGACPWPGLPKEEGCRVVPTPFPPFVHHSYERSAFLYPMAFVRMADERG